MLFYNFLTNIKYILSCYRNNILYISMLVLITSILFFFFLEFYYLKSYLLFIIEKNQQLIISKNNIHNINNHIININNIILDNQKDFDLYFTKSFLIHMMYLSALGFIITMTDDIIFTFKI